MRVTRWLVYKSVLHNRSLVTTEGMAMLDPLLRPEILRHSQGHMFG